MATFTGETQMDALDAVTVISILEHCDPLETMVKYMYRNAIHGMLMQEVVCLRCMCAMFNRNSLAGDGRAIVIDRVAAGQIFMLSVAPRGEEPCRRCGLLRVIP